MSQVAELAVRVGADITPLQRGLRRGGKDVDRFSKRVAANGQMIRVWSVAIIAAATMLVALGKDAFAAADSIDKASRAANIGAERLQTLRFAAEQSGISTGKMDTALAKFNVTLGKVTSGMETSSSTVVLAFNQLGLSVDQLSNSGLSTEQTFDMVMQRLAGVKDGAEQAAIAAQLFGRSAGPDMRNLLVAGVEGIRDLEQAARDGGAVISTALISRGVEMADKWSLIMNNLVSVTRRGALSMAVVMDNMFGFTETGAINKLDKEVGELAQRRIRLFDEINFTKERLGRSKFGGGDSSLITMQAEMEGLTDQINGLEGQIKSIEDLRNRRSKSLKFLLQVPDPVDGGNLPDPGTGRSGGGSGSAAGNGEYERLAERWKTRLELITEKQLEEQSILADARAKNLIDEETYQQQLLKLNEDYAAARGQVANLEAAAKLNTVLGAGAEVLGAMGAFNAKALKAAKVFGAAQALISTWQGSAEALKGPFPANIAAAATIAAKGLAMVGAIKSVSAGGGGGGAVGGGGGGAAAAAPAPLQVHASGFTADRLFTGDMIPAMFDKIQDEAGDRGVNVVFS